MFVGPGDDAAVAAHPEGHVVVSTDLLVEGTALPPRLGQAGDIGRKAAAANLSDVNAMGGTAHSLTVGLAAPPDLPVQWALDLADGIAEEAALVGASIVGGDLTTADEVVVAITVLGTCEVAPVLRSGAQPGDVVALAGRQGWAAAGLAVLGRGLPAPRARSSRPTSAPSRRTPPGWPPPQRRCDRDDRRLRRAGRRRSGTSPTDSGVAIDIARRRLRARRADAGGRVRAGRRPDAVRPRRRRRPRDRRDVPAGTDLPEGFTAIGTVGEPGEGAVSRSTARRTTDRTGWSHF